MEFPAKEPEELGELFQKHGDGLFNVIARLIGSYDEAHDVLQEAFLKALRGWGGFRGHAQPRTWLYRIAVKSANSIYVSKTHLLFRKQCGVLFSMDTQEAEKWLALSLPGQVNGFWDAIKRSTTAGRSKVYTAGAVEDLKQHGFIEFLRSFDARPNLPP